MAGGLSGKVDPSHRTATAGGFSAQDGGRRATSAGPARIYAQTRPNPLGQSPAISWLALAGDQCARPKASLLDDGLPLPRALAGGIDLPPNQVGPAPG